LAASSDRPASRPGLLSTISTFVLFLPIVRPLEKKRGLDAIQQPGKLPFRAHLQGNSIASFSRLPGSQQARQFSVHAPRG
jgi:hypothetical protein